LNTLLAA